MRGQTLPQLLEVVQCSEDELKGGLNDLEAVCLDDKWYLLDVTYKERIVTLILKFIEENSWDFTQVNKAETVAELKEIENESVLQQVFDHFVQNSVLNKPKISRFFGEYLLKTAGNLFNLEDFLEMWKSSMHEEIRPELDHLKGLALVNEEKGTLRHFPEEDLPENVHERFKILFSAKEKWKLEEIGPYVERLTTPKLNVNALLTKYARASKAEDGSKLFGAKHGN